MDEDHVSLRIPAADQIPEISQVLETEMLAVRDLATLSGPKAVGQDRTHSGIACLSHRLWKGIILS